MATQQLQLVCDSSTLANFKQWAQAISSWFTACGWTQSGDTGQVNWSSISTPPGSAAYVYEVWKPGDGLAAYYLMEYGNFSGTNCPTLRITVSTGTNGAGVATGYILGPITVNGATYTAPSAVTQYECDFSGDAGRMGVMMWRNGINTCQQFFALERSLSSSGTPTSSYVSLWVCGDAASNLRCSCQGSLVFGVGVPPYTQAANSAGGWMVRVQSLSGATTAFNGQVPFDTCAPVVGFYDYPCTVCGAAAGVDVVEGVPFSVTLYGATRTYLPSKLGYFCDVNPYNLGSPSALCMRYD
jgi:hypothetical protein